MNSNNSTVSLPTNASTFSVWLLVLFLWNQAFDSWGNVHFYLISIALPILCVIGVIENILSIYV